MTDSQWEALVAVVEGRLVHPLPVGLIVDCPWLPGWAGVTILDYLTDDQTWLEVNRRAVHRFPHVWFLPGFWAEYGMCTEPSAFGARCLWPENDFPHAQPVLFDYPQIDRLKKPDCRREGMCPFVIKRLERLLGAIEREGHCVRFAASRGPMNIAAHLLGHTETLIGLKTEPERLERLLGLITEFIVDWLQWQAQRFPTIEGILVLDDLIGFVGEADFQRFVIPCFQQIAQAIPARVKILHNDCHGLLTARHLTEMGFNVFNFSFEHSLSEIRALAGPEVVLLGNIPPRDVLAQGTPEDVRRATAEALRSLDDHRRLIVSCGGGVPPGVPSENIDALCAAVADCSPPRTTGRP